MCQDTWETVGWSAFGGVAKAAVKTRKPKFHREERPQR
jgi:hypothetical protein